MNHTDIFLPVKNKVSYSIFLASIAQVLKLSIWLMLIWVLYQLMLDASVFPGLPILSLLVLSILFYTLRTYAHDKSHYAAFELEEILRTRLIKKSINCRLKRLETWAVGILLKH